MRKTEAASERVEQKALVRYLNCHPVLKNYFCKNDNEGKRTPIQGYNLKLMGLRPGLSDLFIYYPTAIHHGLFLEIKRNMSYSKSSRSTPCWVAQERFLDVVRGVGYAGEFCYGWENGKDIIERYISTGI